MFVVYININFTYDLFIRRLRSSPHGRMQRALTARLRGHGSRVSRLAASIGGLQSRISRRSGGVSNDIGDSALVRSRVIGNTAIIRNRKVAVALTSPVTTDRSSRSSSAEINASAGVQIVASLSLRRLISLVFRGKTRTVTVGNGELNTRASVHGTNKRVLVNVATVRDPCAVRTVNSGDTLTRTVKRGELTDLCSSFGRTNVCPRIDGSGSVALRTTIANRIGCTREGRW